MTKYLLSCKCGESTAVRIQQAGKSVRCRRCGNDLIIPTLRSLRELPPADAREVKVHDGLATKGWTPAQGWLFALGVLVVIVSIGVISYCHFERRKLNLDKPSMAALTRLHRDLSQVGLLEAWDIWTKVEKSPLVRRGRPIYLVHRELDAHYRNIMLVSVGFGLAGLVSVVIALSASGRRLRSQ